MSKGLYAPGGALGEVYGTYEQRVVEYRFAAQKAFELGIFRHDSPILDIGCRNPYMGLLRFLREWGWDDDQASRWLDTPYVGIDVDVDEATKARAAEDPLALIIEADLNAFTFDDNGGRKQFSVAFCLEVLEHIGNATELVDQLQQVAATIMVIGPHAGFRGYRMEIDDHVLDMSEAMLREWGFQEIGFVNFNGFPSKGAALPYPIANGKKETCSEVWGLWRDGRAQALWDAKPAQPTAVDITVDSGPTDYLKAGSLLHAAGHELKVEQGGRRGR